MIKFMRGRGECGIMKMEMKRKPLVDGHGVGIAL
jgi:hypothetical protein